MSRYLWGLVAGGVLVAGCGLGFALTLIYLAARDRRTARQRATQNESIFEAGIRRQTARLRAELDDPAAVDRWLAGDAR